MGKQISLLLLSLFLTVQTAFAASVGQRVITLGSDLDANQKQTILSEFNHTNSDQVVEVQKTDEEHYLGLHGSGRELSSAMIVIKDKGNGLKVSVSPMITQVNETIYKNALLTAGIEDADVSITSPTQVTGTAALTGIYKAFEVATGKTLNATRTKVAGEEVTDSAKLGQQIGDPQLAATLIQQLKEALKQWNPKTDDDYRKMIETVAKDAGITLTPDQEQTLVDLLKQINALNINWDQLSQEVGQWVKENPQKTNAILEFCKEFIASLQTLIQKWFGH